MKKLYFYTFRYKNGAVVLSGGSAGISIMDPVDHTKTKVGDVVYIEQFSISGSFPSSATIIGKLSYDWDMSKPIGQRKSNEVIEGVGYLINR